MGLHNIYIVRIRAVDMKKLAFVLFFILIGSFVLADMSISEPLDVYNLGDRLYVSVDGLRGTNNGNLNIDLVCRNSTVNLVRISARAFSGEEDQGYSIPYKILDYEDLEILNLDSIVGNCQIISSLGDGIVSSKMFEISDDVIVSGSLDKNVYNPGDAVTVTVDAIRENGANLNGFVESGNASFFSKAVVDGAASEVFIIPETAEAGIYFLTIKAYDVGTSGVLNSGQSVVSYEVNQVASSLVMSLADVVAIPGEVFTIGANVFDQAGVEMNGLVVLKVISPTEESLDATIDAGSSSEIVFPLNSTVGTWRVFTSFEGLEQVREFEMTGVQKVDFDFEDSVLTVMNIGNVLYNKTIDVSIGDEIMTLDLKIEPGEIRKFSVGAPNGEYEVLIDDGDTSISRQVLLTGNAVSLSDFRDGNFLSMYPILWIFLILILAGIGIVLTIRYRKTRTVKKGGFLSKILAKLPGKKKVAQLHKVGVSAGGKVRDKMPEGFKSRVENSLTFTNKSPAVQGLDIKNYSHEDKSMVDLTRDKHVGAESALVLKGEKQRSSVVAIALKNHDSIGDAGKEALSKIVIESKGKGLIDWRGDFVFVVFSPVATRTYSNDGLAVKCGIEISENLSDYNRKFKDKVEFGIGVHSGDLIASKGNGKLKYTGIGNTISFAKRMSDSDSGRVIVSDDVRKKLIRDLKVDKGKDIGENLTYIVSEIKKKGGDQAKLRELLKRQKATD